MDHETAAAGRTDDREPIDEDAPTGGDAGTEEQLTADNAVEEDMLKTLDPGDAPV